ncbi:hypothetical protein [Flavobacterium sharifuzzamanii]|uniref:hypothetical protein n=1 Tax=Flavobacterium sharifuzzamanii TaxID=2211133 RepID=UPI001300AC42|nr:hypothetical protein [Flavobacterium sharifuzzamanii]KAF2081408.1 hypothetical protein DMA14_10455 [Flavobacterium sharifuzzamanii]
MNRFLMSLIFVVSLVSCQNSKKEIYVALEKFDNSLDSLIVGKVYDEPKMLIFQGDTLYGNPKGINETCYQIVGSDSVKVDANCHIYKFKNNQLVINSSENFLGEKFVQKFIYFKDKIDNRLVDDLRKVKSDTVYFGCLKKYDEMGNVVKKVINSTWKEIQKGGTVVINENRILEVSNYNSSNKVTIWRKEYFNKQYNVDSLRNTDVERIASSKFNGLDEGDYSYKGDKHGNWVVKKSDRKENPDVYYREIIY